MPKTITITALDGSKVQYVDEIIGSGAQKDVYFSPDRSYVVAFFRNKQDANAQERLQNIVGVYREKIFNGPGGDYWTNLFCWPQKLVEDKGRLGVVVPAYQKKFFFEDGPFKGKEKNGKWFASAKLRNKFLTPAQKGSFLDTLHTCIKIARAVRRLHAAGLAHSDLSYNNVLVDPSSGSACIIDCDGLVVPGKYPPDVVGTPDFIAPEVIKTQKMPLNDPDRFLPSIYTDRHALAVLIYMYLLNRHPLRGGKVWNTDPAIDESLSMGEKALFIEHPANPVNRPKIDQMAKAELPQGDINKLPYSICGPYLQSLFNRAFIDGLHDRTKRPSAAEWEDALIKTTDLTQPCQNTQCEQRWFVFDNTTKPKCPFCGKEYHGLLPVLNLYYSPRHGKFIPENYRLMVYNKQSLYPWHMDRSISPNEKLSPTERKPVGDFHLHNGKWILINRRMDDLYLISSQGKKTKINHGEYAVIEDGTQLLLSDKENGRLAVVQMVSN